MNLKLSIVAAIIAATTVAGAAEVKRPSICPDWTGAKVATWTMDYESALANAKAEGQYTILMFSGMWWCPHCQFLEENVLATDEWKNYAQERGFYECVLDFPNRSGDDYWCWLWDSDYRTFAGLSAMDAAAEIVARYDVQTAYSVKGASKQKANNMIVEGTYGDAIMTPYAQKPTSKYTRVGYPTMIVLDPSGRELGRFTPDKRDDEYKADPFGWVKAKIESIAVIPAPIIPIEAACQYSGILLNDGSLVGTVSCKTSKPNKKTNLASVAFTFVAKDGKKKTIKSNVYSAEGAQASLTDKSGNVLEFTLTSEEVFGTFNGEAFRTFPEVFSKDAEAEAKLDSVKGNWTLVVNGSFTYATGCESCGTYKEGTASRATLNVSIGAKGKTKISGNTSAGSKVSTSSQLIYAYEGELYLPVIDKKSGMSFVLFLDGDGIAHTAFEANYEELIAFARPPASLAEPLIFSCDDGTTTELTVKNGKTLTNADLSLKFTYTAKTGVCKGSYTKDGVKVSVNGAFAGSEGYLFATPKGGSVINAKIVAGEDCGDCHE